MNEQLLILDLDETLIYSSETPLEREFDFRVGVFHTYKRPYLKEFLEFCFENFSVAVWTSSTRNYAKNIIKNILNENQNLKFLHSRERCTLSYDEETRENFYSKKLTKLRRRGVNLDSIIVVDDSPEQWRDSYGNLVKVKRFVGETGDDELKFLIRYLAKLKDVDNIRKLEKRGWKNRI
ncbi:MAG: HAD family hydrolase [Acidobacteriota bacterium]